MLTLRPSMVSLKQQLHYLSIEHQGTQWNTQYLHGLGTSGDMLCHQIHNEGEFGVVVSIT